MRYYEYTRSGSRVVLTEGATRALVLIAAPLVGYVAGGLSGLTPSAALTAFCSEISHCYEGLFFWLGQTLGGEPVAYSEAHPIPRAFAKHILDFANVHDHDCFASDAALQEVRARMHHNNLKVPSVLAYLFRQQPQLLTEWTQGIHELATREGGHLVTVGVAREPLLSAYATALGAPIEQVGLDGGQGYVILYDGTPHGYTVQPLIPPGTERRMPSQEEA